MPETNIKFFYIIHERFNTINIYLYAAWSP